VTSRDCRAEPPGSSRAGPAAMTAWSRAGPAATTATNSVYPAATTGSSRARPAVTMATRSASARGRRSATDHGADSKAREVASATRVPTRWVSGRVRATAAGNRVPALIDPSRGRAATRGKSRALAWMDPSRGRVATTAGRYAAVSMASRHVRLWAAPRPRHRMSSAASRQHRASRRSLPCRRPRHRRARSRRRASVPSARTCRRHPRDLTTRGPRALLVTAAYLFGGYFWSLRCRLRR
jgi:hypothetical protein